MFAFAFDGALFAFAEPRAHSPPLFRFAPNRTPLKMSRPIFQITFVLDLDLDYPATSARKPPPKSATASDGA